MMEDMFNKVFQNLMENGFGNFKIHTSTLDPIVMEERLELFKKHKKDTCGFCKGKYKGFITTIVRAVKKHTGEEILLPICHVCYNQTFRLGDNK